MAQGHRKMMKIGKKKKSGDGKPAGRPGDGQGRGIRWFWSTTGAASALVVLVLGMAAFWLQVQQVNQSRENQVRIGADGLAARLGDAAGHYRRVLAGIVQDPALASLFINKDVQGLHRKEITLRSLLPNSLRIRLVPAGVKEPDRGETPNLSYSSLALLRVAEKSAQAPSLEVHLLNSAQAHVALAQRIPPETDKEALGVLYVAVPLAMVQRVMNEVSDYGGVVEIQQLLDSGKTVALASNGAAERRGRAADGIVPVPGTIWQVAYWHAPLSASQWQDFLLLWGLIAVAALIVVLVIFLQFHGLRARLKRDQSSLVRLFDDFIEGTLAHQYPAAISELDSTLQLMRQRAHDARHAGPGQFAGRGKVTPSAQGAGGDPPASPSRVVVPVEIFRAYDIRGVVGGIFGPELAYAIGRAIGSEAYERGDQTVIVGRDGRKSSPELSEALCRGLQETGRDVVDLGTVPTPVVYFATHFLGTRSGVVVTGSHNPPEYNGFKVVLAGETLSGDAIQALRQRIEQADYLSGEGGRQEQNLVPDYVNRINDDVRVARPMRVVVDAGNGVAGAVMPAVLRAMGCEVVELFCEIDGDFPNHHPDPSQPENLQSLILEVAAREADLGVALDGDGDRIGVVDSAGNIIWPDRLLMLLAADALSRQPGADVIFDVKCSRNLASEIVKAGGRPVMAQTGHSLIKAKMRETGALLAGEMSGHIFFQERWFGFDDAIYACARLLEILSADVRSSAEVFGELPDSVATPELHLAMAEGESLALMERLLAEVKLPGAKLITIDGLRAEFEDGWGLVRASNTAPALVFRFEANSEASVERIKGVFRSLILSLQPGLKLPF